MPYVLILAGWLTALTTLVDGLHGWNELMTPKVVFGALGLLGTQITGFYMQSPGPRGNHDA